MTTERCLDDWRTAGIVSPDQHATLTALVRKERVSLFVELNALLYLGVIAFVAGLGVTIRERFADLGDTAILSGLALVVAATFYYCLTRTPPYSPERVESPTFAFDYVLYLGCLTVAATFGYLEYRFHLLQESWDLYLLASALLYFAFAYRFDNRFVLSLALSTLGGWFGVRLSSWAVLPSAIRALAVLYGAVVAAIGAWTARASIKRHFLETYLHVAANAILLGLVSGAIMAPREPWWLPALVLVSAAAAVLGVRFKQFSFVVYGVAYAYVGLSARVIDGLRGMTAALVYLVVSSLVVVGGLVVVSRRFGGDS
jgi:hypothetical protein